MVPKWLAVLVKSQQSFNLAIIRHVLLDPGVCLCVHQVAELHRQLAPHMLRRLKKDVLKQLPPKMEQMVRHQAA